MPGKYESPAGNGANEAFSGGLGTSDFTTDYPIDPIYESKLTGWLEGWHQRDPEIERLGLIADRLYAEMCRRKPVPFEDPNRPSYADLERIRGNSANADRIDAANAARFEQVTS